jgi:GR25 family glycosyltransferase involved in LPS biosynthesis
MEGALTKKEEKIPAVLIILYRRFKNLESIIKVALKAGIPRIYIALDVPPSQIQSEEYLFERNLSLEKLKSVCAAEGVELHVWIRRENLGCARSVLSACQWFFSREIFGVVLEDDCIPTLEFFEFVTRNRELLENDKRINFICGTQHANITTTSKDTSFILSSYPFLWGWATSNSKWNVMIEVFLNPNINFYSSKKGIFETSYWRTGIRRAFQRRVDVWDTIIVGVMALNGMLAILPLKNLINNVGLDDFATNHHADENSRLWNIFLRSGPWQEVHNVDSTIRKNFFKINWFMPVRNSMRFILDSLSPSRKTTLSKVLARDFQEIPRS